MTAHTSGPWTVNKDRRGAGKIYVREAKLSEVAGATAGRAVAQVTAVVGFAEQAANAELIASAPDLLSTLRAVGLHLSVRPESRMPETEWALRLLIAEVMAAAEGRP